MAIQSLTRRIDRLTTIVREQGAGGAAKFLSRKIARFATAGTLYPENSIRANLEQFNQQHDWSQAGEEWTASPEWKQSVVSQILDPNIPAGSRVLEIGPGAGRWTEFLIPRASRLVLVDLAPKCIEMCRERFGNRPNLEYFVNDGCDLSFVAPNSLDRIWSFDVFVHIAPEDIGRYLDQFRTVLAPGGIAVIHHANNSGSRRGWRSTMSAERMSQMCRDRGFRVIDQFNQWRGGSLELDAVTIFGS